MCTFFFLLLYLSMSISFVLFSLFVLWGEWIWFWCYLWLLFACQYFDTPISAFWKQNMSWFAMTPDFTENFHYYRLLLFQAALMCSLNFHFMNCHCCSLWLSCVRQISGHWHSISNEMKWNVLKKKRIKRRTKKLVDSKHTDKKKYEFFPICCFKWTKLLHLTNGFLNQQWNFCSLSMKLTWIDHYGHFNWNRY